MRSKKCLKDRPLASIKRLYINKRIKLAKACLLRRKRFRERHQISQGQPEPHNENSLVENNLAGRGAVAEQDGGNFENQEPVVMNDVNHVGDGVGANRDPLVFLERIHSYNWTYNNFRTNEHYEEFHSVNLDRIASYVQAIDDVHGAVQRILDEISLNIGVSDFVQLRLTSGGYNKPLFSCRRRPGELNAADFLNQISDLLQSHTKVLTTDSLRLVVTIVRNMQGGASRFKSVLYSRVIEQKKAHLIDLHYAGGNLCFSGCVYGLLNEGCTHGEMLQGAKQMQKELGFPENRKISLSDITAFEKHLKVVLYHDQGDWKYFTMGPTPPNSFCSTA
nr:PREDICTED: uncharacterized protein LOC107077365 [Lepisosteus oculatus]XP_015202571.1 PREDICTED: uncharacterized protein LOC107077365 [Lepisosteus oculatus]XP_015202572.1 PREDICTED: uncharacterized protein LOC107077365 [Lepisosteus oculatus]XP_015202573.1 PREDICTED: uncharacterized protein LOC107077365 [Lepisosteus oculatus]